MQNFQNGVEFLNKLRVIFYAMIGGPLLLFLVLYFMNREGRLSPIIELTDGADTIPFIIGGLCAVIAVAAYILYGKNLKAVREESTLRSKLQKYFTYNMVKFAMLEGACMIALVGFLLTNNTIFQGFYVLLMVVMAISNPTIYSLLNDLRPSKEEARILKSNEPIE